MRGEELRAWVDEQADALEDFTIRVLDGYDDCIVGIAWQFGKPMIVYDRARIIQRLMAEDMTHDEAMEFHHFNQAGAWNGPGTPAFLDVPEPILDEEEPHEDRP